MNVLIFNCGSSSQIFKVYAVQDEHTYSVIAEGKAKNVATQTLAEPCIEWQIGAQTGTEKLALASHRQAAVENMKLLAAHSIQVNAIGHRFVHGGDIFTQTTLLTPENLEEMQKCFLLAPLHNPNSYSVIEVCRKELPGIPQFAVFDTAFHSQLPPEATRYAIPRELAQKFGFRKYSFHGLSYSYVSDRAARLLGKPLSSLRLILCHL